jgi:hypothetical protein
LCFAPEKCGYRTSENRSNSSLALNLTLWDKLTASIY